MACTIDCTVFFAKALACQNINHFNIPTSIPTIGADPIVDTCLCVQSAVSSMHTCASCRAKNDNTTDVTNVFISACNQEFPGRNLVLESSASASPQSLSPKTKLGAAFPLVFLVFMTCASVILG
ncbi:hypothetical protein EMPS_10557 [Entomortierella parvispora]|uniref:Uncharacterized protein n=1 Tax=Entomortierella parvispora TaxID=205924 RepID=A0A9P3HKS4_9FUNG|nr:hypothetical protein EMPS_10557 [Entomortierella parvispora]